jgi:CRP/FNR family cyclic AMP-dependent transcriptional regulator
MNTASNLKHSNTTKINFSLSVVRQFKKDDFVYRQGQNASKVFRLNKGMIVIGNQNLNGEFMFSHFVKQGDYFGEEVLLSLQNRKNFAQVLTTEAIIEEIQFSEILAQPLLMNEIYQNCIKRIYQTEETLYKNNYLSLKNRVIQTLRFFVDNIGIKLLNGEVIIREHLKHKEIAFLCNASRQSVSTEIASLIKKGFLKVDRSSILFSDGFLKMSYSNL